MEEVRDIWAVPKLEDGVLRRSLYGNLAELGGVPWKDRKVYAGHSSRTVRHMLRKHVVISCEPQPHPELLNFLREFSTESHQCVSLEQGPRERGGVKRFFPKQASGRRARGYRQTWTAGART